MSNNTTYGEVKVQGFESENQAAPMSPSDELATIASLKVDVERALKQSDKSISLAIFGLYVAIIAVVGIVIACVAFAVTQITQISEQTRILQEIETRMDI